MPLTTETIEMAAAKACKNGDQTVSIFADCTGQDMIGATGSGFLEKVCTINAASPAAGIAEYKSLRK